MTNSNLRNSRVERVLACLSLANLLLLETWRNLQPNSAEAFLVGSSHTAWLPLIVILVLVMLALALHAMDRVIPEGSLAGITLRTLAAAVFLIIITNGLRRIVATRYASWEAGVLANRFGNWWLYGILLAATTGLIASYLLFRRPVTALTKRVLLILSPLPAVFFFYTFLWPATHVHASGVVPSCQRRPGRAPIVLWIFDEMDQGWTFDHRPAHLRLPNLDSFRDTSTWASSAFPPASETIRSVPALLVGKRLEAVAMEAGQELRIKPEGAASVLWSASDDLMTEACRQGYATLLVNHVHPFPPSFFTRRPLLRVLHHDYYPFWKDWRERYHTPAKAVGSILEDIAAGVPGYRKTEESRKPAVPFIRNLVAWMERVSLGAIRENSCDLLVVHWPIPHDPALLDAQTLGPPKELPTADSNHLDNLLIVDELLGQLKITLEERGEWDQATVIVTSDHWQRRLTRHGIPDRRPNDHRIPLLIKFPFQKRAVEVASPLNSLAVYGLILDTMKGSRLGPADLERFAATWPPQGLYLSIYD